VSGHGWPRLASEAESEKTWNRAVVELPTPPVSPAGVPGAFQQRSGQPRRHPAGVTIGDVQRKTITVGTFERTYRVAVPPQLPALLLLVLHGMRIDGRRMASWTGLAERGPAAGFSTVFADAWREVWDDQGLGRFDGVDDAAFVKILVDQLVSDGVARAGALFLVGLSNGAFFAECLARHGHLEATGIVLVAGTARAASRRLRTRPSHPTAVLLFAGESGESC
jgi:poly(3-hydroxybutyrate) depolymerase